MVKQDHRLQSLLYQLGIAGLVSDIQGETADEFSQRLYSRMVAAGRFGDMLGVCIVPDELRDSDWTPDVCDTTAEFIMKLTDQTDKEKVQQLAEGILLSFLQAASEFSKRSQILSVSQRLNGQAPARGGNENQRRWTDASRSQDSGALDFGTASSGRSPGKTLSGLRKFLTSLSRKRSGLTTK